MHAQQLVAQEAQAYLVAQRGDRRGDLRGALRDGQLSVYLHEGFWHPMDTYRDYLHLNDLWKRGETPWKRW